MRTLAYVLPALSVATMFLACGSRTGLLLPEDEEPVGDAASDHAVVAEAGRDAGADVRVEADAAGEAEAQAEAEAEADAPIDVQFRDVPVIDLCPDAGDTLVYVLTDGNALLSFYPPTLAFSPIGTIACPTSETPFSMAVDRRGIAYSVFSGGGLFRVDTASAACEPTTYVPGQSGFDTFGMGFTANTGDAGETLFVAEATATGGKPNSQGLASLDVTTFGLSFVGPFNPAIPGPELTGTSDGRLFAFYTNATGSGSHVIEVDKNSGKQLADHPLTVGGPNDAYAFAFWGGQFWIFTSPGGTSQVTLFDPTTSAETPVTTFAGTIVGAGVSTCAPQ